MSENTEALLSDVRTALHRQRIWSHAPDKQRPGWHAQPSMIEGIPAVTLTWRGVKVPDYHAHMAELSAGSVAAGWLVELERRLERDFIIGRLFETRPDIQPGRALVGLLVFHSGESADSPPEQTGR
ncbi:hypothetical protein AB0C96_09790 [Streptomyces sp. NPDC048506]|uniref:hypothetical protein n=1 Tax=Streptomyces sp. NPDC048506 TaxID=3155028 RepID=UPI003446B863